MVKYLLSYYFSAQCLKRYVKAPTVHLMRLHSLRGAKAPLPRAPPAFLHGRRPGGHKQARIIFQESSRYFSVTCVGNFTYEYYILHPLSLLLSRFQPRKNRHWSSLFLSSSPCLPSITCEACQTGGLVVKQCVLCLSSILFYQKNTHLTLNCLIFNLCQLPL